MLSLLAVKCQYQLFNVDDLSTSDQFRIDQNSIT